MWNKWSHHVPFNPLRLSNMCNVFRNQSLNLLYPVLNVLETGCDASELECIAKAVLASLMRENNVAEPVFVFELLSLKQKNKKLFFLSN